MSPALLILNAGSSSIKFALFVMAADQVPQQAEIVGQIDGLGATPWMKARNKGGKILADQAPELGAQSGHHAALGYLVDWLGQHNNAWQIVGVGHRVVHGGQDYAQPVRLTADIINHLTELTPLAPLHQPHNLAGIRALTAALPNIPQVACFDTAFHRSQPPLEQLYALPRRIIDQGVRRYGFHGLSYEYIAQVLPAHLPQQAHGRVIVAHLGNGASMCALLAGKSVATSMGFTAIEGLMMGTRSGSVDPGVLLYLMANQGMNTEALTRLLYKESGLLGVSGISQDMRALLASPSATAHEAVALFCHRIVRETGSLAAAIGGLDALVFTGGIGEHAAFVRATVCARLHWLGIELDEQANARDEIHIGKGATAVLVLPTNEEWMIARHTAALI